jgi:CubicO group peptidase (beta-lactamase class C family)
MHSQRRFDLVRRLRHIMESAVNEARIAGGVVVVAHDGQVIVEEAFGLENVASNTSMHSQARFRLASVTKPIICFAALRLVDAGRLSLDEPITRWLPYFRPSLSDGSTPDITLHQLLTHTSGLSYGFQEAAGTEYHELKVSDGLDCAGLTLKQNLERLAMARLHFGPGTAWKYSLAIDVIGAIIEQVTGRSLPHAIDELVISPLELPSLAFTVPVDVALAVPYVTGERKVFEMEESAMVRPPDGVNAIRFSPGRAYSTNDFPSGGAGMVGTAIDILRFLEATRTNGGGLLTTELSQLIAEPHVSADMRGQQDGWGFGYMGAVLMEPSILSTPQTIGTVEWGGVYGHNWFVDRAAALTVVSLTNTTWEGVGGRFPLEVRDAVYGALI